ncbi:hypothetical protein [Metabacillus endolithicus]|uniref:Uncharacterized protein n=1 Tax=Metabacillus endolithicus TaxID=1535204 RepID=A0ABW5BQN0_9BACI|nr:hypothetical protein [Metabacillus endolithicus]
MGDGANIATGAVVTNVKVCK